MEIHIIGAVVFFIAAIAVVGGLPLRYYIKLDQQNQTRRS